MSWVIFTVVALTTLFPAISQAKGVFAHFMVANSDNFTRDDWISDFTAAKAAHIDAFAMNAGWGMNSTADSLDKAFAAAAEVDFKLFLSLDYSGDGHWPQDQVIIWLSKYTKLEAYYKHRGMKPLVSTFEGTESAGDWTEIKKKVNCTFIPDWTSLGAAKASKISVIDGLMSWDAWPNGTTPMDTDEDEGYMEHLRGKPYIMPVSPWFYTNLVRYNKNWVWQGDDLWYTRWQQVLEVDPEYVEIITWNDFGESHYIGPLHDKELSIFSYGEAPFNYALGMPHDGWRALLPYAIDQFKNPQRRDEIAIEKELLTVWYRLSPGSACKDGKTTGNTVSQNQKTIAPQQVLQDKVFFSALLESMAEVSVSIGGTNHSVSWTNVPQGGKGIYHGNFPMDKRTGEVVVTLSRNDRFLAQMHGQSISSSCPKNQTNWNAWVGNATAVDNRTLTTSGKPESSASVLSAYGSLIMASIWVCVGWILS
ncbi:hypothetical protein P175DRAFT_0425632 [Aspergillus ochraceoroseus IBT 24754]|uniref:Glycoside hydrolase n=2 Tax=Aspergillus ochraceoroseus TaxID=138278 RepID=A0A2T5M625_9EURO|nr:uncharacterized protein P175DRAFT_0425632 [Aspergillus ochraceoroseus IBT 24754]KKK20390.1 hypothetical protein AOCH_005223 [Aspergillus ochraceoroseus]PTU23982.1 hypothetical protein P175DRAFT_0425632 [Aspergillus ochraceoroseus IBT 24754]